MDETRRELILNMALLVAMAPIAAAAAIPSPVAGADRPITLGPSWTRTRAFVLPKAARTPADLKTARLVPPFDSANVRNESLASAPLIYSGQYIGMAWIGGTGERDELGLETDTIARWLCGIGSFSNMIAVAEGHGQIPIHFRHRNGVASLNGGDMVDITDPRMKMVSSYDNQAAVSASPWFGPIAGPVATDASHMPSMSYVPYLVTGDPYYLQELQDAANYFLIVQNPAYRAFGKGLLPKGQTRAYAWALREVAKAYLATPEATPDGMLPKSYWAAILENNRIDFDAQYVKNGVNRPATGCHLAIDVEPIEGRWFRPWQQDYLGFVMGWMIWTGDPLLAKWRGNYEWLMRFPIDMTSGKSGFPRSQSIQYDGDLIGVSDMATLAAVNGYKETASGRIDTTVADRSYMAYRRGNLKMAMLNGVPGAAECLAWLDPQVKWIPAKWAV